MEERKEKGSMGGGGGRKGYSNPRHSEGFTCSYSTHKNKEVQKSISRYVDKRLVQRRSYFTEEQYAIRHNHHMTFRHECVNLTCESTAGCDVWVFLISQAMCN